MILSVHQPQYIPWLGYLDKIARSDAFVFLDCVQYKEREFQNRNKIRTRGGWAWLTVPVVSKGKGRQRIDAVLIDNQRPWRRQHHKSLCTWYAHAPFFARYEPFLAQTYAREWVRLIDLNVHIIRFLLEEFGIATPLSFESQYGIAAAKTERIIALCETLGAGTYLSGAGGRDYLDEGSFAAHGIALQYQSYRHPQYRQQWGDDGTGFIPNLSALDLLFNEGPQSGGHFLHPQHTEAL